MCISFNINFDIQISLVKSTYFYVIYYESLGICISTLCKRTLLGEDALLKFHRIERNSWLEFINFTCSWMHLTPRKDLQSNWSVTTLQADFRLGWNSLLAGFVGVWHYVNVTDFQYSYKIYTPIEGFEENGIVVKLLLKEGLDSEVSVKLAQYKVTCSVYITEFQSLILCRCVFN